MPQTMSHFLKDRKMIVTKVIKKLPSMNDHLKYIKTAEEFNALSHALYHFFNSETLTKADYFHLVKVLIDKLPVYMKKRDLDQFENLVLIHAQFNYPPCEEFPTVVHGLLTATPALDLQILYYALYTLREKLPDCTEFVGVEVLSGRTISLRDITDAELKSIRAIIGLK